MRAFCNFMVMYNLNRKFPDFFFAPPATFMPVPIQLEFYTKVLNKKSSSEDLCTIKDKVRRILRENPTQPRRGEQNAFWHLTAQ